MPSAQSLSPKGPLPCSWSECAYRHGHQGRDPMERRAPSMGCPWWPYHWNSRHAIATTTLILVGPFKPVHSAISMELPRRTRFPVSDHRSWKRTFRPSAGSFPIPTPTRRRFDQPANHLHNRGVASKKATADSQGLPVPSVH